MRQLPFCRPNRELHHESTAGKGLCFLISATRRSFYLSRRSATLILWKQLRDSIRPEYAYAFEPTSESNIVKQTNKASQTIDQVSLSDSVDAEYVFDHTTTIYQLKEPRLKSLFTTFKETKQTIHSGDGNVFPYIVRTFILCEEDGLPIETENCTDNIYILVQPTELGYESNLFKISRLFDTRISKLRNTNEGVVLTLEHSRFPRTQLNVLVKPELVKFLK